MPLIVTADRAVASVTATGSDDWEVTSTPTGFRGITSADFADNDKVAGFVLWENGVDYEVYDTLEDDDSTLLEITNISGTVQISRPATPFKSSNGGSRVAAGSGTHTLVVGMGSGTAARLLRETNPTWKTFTNADATPDVSGYRLFKTNGTTTITAFDGMEAGKFFVVQRGGADITIADGAGISLPGDHDITLTAADPGAIFVEDGGVAVLVGRTGTVVLDEDDFASDSATRPPSQQSVGAYVSQAPNISASTTLTLSSGAFTPTVAAHVLAAESGTADDITDVTMTAFKVGAQVRVKADAGDILTVKTTGNISTDTGQDIVITGDRYVVFTKTASGVDAAASYIDRGLAIDLMEYGCVGDGTTEDTTRFQAAITAAIANVSSLTGVPARIISPPNKAYLVEELTYTDDIVFDMNGSELRGKFNDSSSGYSANILKKLPSDRTLLANDLHGTADAINGHRLVVRDCVFNGMYDSAVTINSDGPPCVMIWGDHVEFHNCTFTRFGQLGAAITGEDEVLDYRNQGVLLYDCPTAKVRDCFSWSNPCEDFVVQSSDKSTVLDIDGLRVDKSRYNSAATTLGQSGLIVYNLNGASRVRNFYLEKCVNSAVNFISEGEFSDFYIGTVTSSTAIDLNEAAIGGYGRAVVRNGYIGSASTTGVRVTGSNILIEDIEFGHNITYPIRIEQDITSDAALPEVPQSDIQATGITIRRLSAPDGLSASGNQFIFIDGQDASNPVRVHVEDIGMGADADASPANKANYTVYGHFCILTVSGMFNLGRTAMFYLEGDGCRFHAKDATFAPESGQTTHVLQMHDVSDGPIVTFDRCERLTSLDASHYDVLWSGTTADMECHRNHSPTIDTIETPTSVRNYIDGRMTLEWNGSIPGLADNGLWSPTTSSVPVNLNEDRVVGVRQDLNQSTLEVQVDARVTADNTITFYVINRSGASFSNPTSIYIDVEVAKAGYIN